MQKVKCEICGIELIPPEKKVCSLCVSAQEHIRDTKQGLDEQGQGNINEALCRV